VRVGHRVAMNSRTRLLEHLVVEPGTAAAIDAEVAVH
jgi:hypothetical protein